MLKLCRYSISLLLVGTLIAAISILSIASTVLPTKTAVNFKNIPSTHWAVHSINWALSESIMGGYLDGTFAPNSQILEAEFVTMFARYASNTNKNNFDALVGKYWS